MKSLTAEKLKVARVLLNLGHSYLHNQSLENSEDEEEEGEEEEEEGEKEEEEEEEKNHQQVRKSLILQELKQQQNSEKLFQVELFREIQVELDCKIQQAVKIDTYPEFYRKILHKWNEFKDICSINTKHLFNREIQLKLNGAIDVRREVKQKFGRRTHLSKKILEYKILQVKEYEKAIQVKFFSEEQLELNKISHKLSLNTVFVDFNEVHYELEVYLYQKLYKALQQVIKSDINQEFFREILHKWEQINVIFTKNLYKVENKVQFGGIKNVNRGIEPTFFNGTHNDLFENVQHKSDENMEVEVITKKPEIFVCCIQKEIDIDLIKQIELIDLEVQVSGENKNIELEIEKHKIVESGVQNKNSDIYMKHLDLEEVLQFLNVHVFNKRRVFDVKNQKNVISIAQKEVNNELVEQIDSEVQQVFHENEQVEFNIEKNIFENNVQKEINSDLTDSEVQQRNENITEFIVEKLPNFDDVQKFHELVEDICKNVQEFEVEKPTNHENNIHLKINNKPLEQIDTNIQVPHTNLRVMYDVENRQNFDDVPEVIDELVEKICENVLEFEVEKQPYHENCIQHEVNKKLLEKIDTNIQVPHENLHEVMLDVENHKHFDDVQEIVNELVEKICANFDFEKQQCRNKKIQIIFDENLQRGYKSVNVEYDSTQETGRDVQKYVKEVQQVNSKTQELFVRAPKEFDTEKLQEINNELLHQVILFELPQELDEEVKKNFEKRVQSSVKVNIHELCKHFNVELKIFNFQQIGKNMQQKFNNKTLLNNHKTVQKKLVSKIQKPHKNDVKQKFIVLKKKCDRKNYEDIQYKFKIEFQKEFNKDVLRNIGRKIQNKSYNNYKLIFDENFKFVSNNEKQKEFEQESICKLFKNINVILFDVQKKFKRVVQQLQVDSKILQEFFECGVLIEKNQQKFEKDKQCEIKSKIMNQVLEVQQHLNRKKHNLVQKAFYIELPKILDVQSPKESCYKMNIEFKEKKIESGGQPKLKDVIQIESSTIQQNLDGKFHEEFNKEKKYNFIVGKQKLFDSEVSFLVDREIQEANMNLGENFDRESNIYSKTKILQEAEENKQDEGSKDTEKGIGKNSRQDICANMEVEHTKELKQGVKKDVRQNYKKIQQKAGKNRLEKKEFLVNIVSELFLAFEWSLQKQLHKNVLVSFHKEMQLEVETIIYHMLFGEIQQNVHKQIHQTIELEEEIRNLENKKGEELEIIIFEQLSDLHNHLAQVNILKKKFLLLYQDSIFFYEIVEQICNVQLPHKKLEKYIREKLQQEVVNDIQHQLDHQIHKEFPRIVQKTLNREIQEVIEEEKSFDCELYHNIDKEVNKYKTQSIKKDIQLEFWNERLLEGETQKMITEDYELNMLNDLQQDIENDLEKIYMINAKETLVNKLVKFVLTNMSLDNLTEEILQKLNYKTQGSSDEVLQPFMTGFIDQEPDGTIKNAQVFLNGVLVMSLRKAQYNYVEILIPNDTRCIFNLTKLLRHVKINQFKGNEKIKSKRNLLRNFDKSKRIKICEKDYQELSGRAQQTTKKNKSSKIFPEVSHVVIKDDKQIFERQSRYKLSKKIQQDFDKTLKNSFKRKLPLKFKLFETIEEESEVEVEEFEADKDSLEEVQEKSEIDVVEFEEISEVGVEEFEDKFEVDINKVEQIQYRFNKLQREPEENNKKFEGKKQQFNKIFLQKLPIKYKTLQNFDANIKVTDKTIGKFEGLNKIETQDSQQRLKDLEQIYKITTEVEEEFKVKYVSSDNFSTFSDSNSILLKIHASDSFIDKKNISLEKLFTTSDEEFTSTEDDFTYLDDDFTCTDEELISTDDESTSLNEEYTTLDKEFSTIYEEFTSIEKEFTTVKEEYSTVEEEFPTVEEEFTTVEEEYSTVEEEFTTIEEEFTTIEEEFISTDKECCLNVCTSTDKDFTFIEDKSNYMEVEPNFLDIQSNLVENESSFKDEIDKTNSAKELHTLKIEGKREFEREMQKESKLKVQLKFEKEFHQKLSSYTQKEFNEIFHKNFFKKIKKHNDRTVQKEYDDLHFESDEQIQKENFEKNTYQYFIDYQNKFYKALQQNYYKKPQSTMNTYDSEFSQFFDEQQLKFYEFKQKFCELKQDSKYIVQQKNTEQFKDFDEKLSWKVDEERKIDMVQVDHNVIEPEFKYNVPLLFKENDPIEFITPKKTVKFIRLTNLLKTLHSLHHKKMYDLTYSKLWPDYCLFPSSLLDSLFENPVQEKPNVLVITLYTENIGYSIKLCTSYNRKPVEIFFDYEEDSLLEYIENEELPPHILDILERSKPSLFYNGRIVVEIHDKKEYIPGKVYRILLHPSNMSIASDKNQIVSESFSSKFSYENQLKIESSLLLATHRKLCMDISPVAGLAVQSQHLLLKNSCEKIDLFGDQIISSSLNLSKEKLSSDSCKNIFAPKCSNETQKLSSKVVNTKNGSIIYRLVWKFDFRLQSYKFMKLSILEVIETREYSVMMYSNIESVIRFRINLETNKVKTYINVILDILKQNISPDLIVVRRYKSLDKSTPRIINFVPLLVNNMIYEPSHADISQLMKIFLENKFDYQLDKTNLNLVKTKPLNIPLQLTADTLSINGKKKLSHVGRMEPTVRVPVSNCTNINEELKSTSNTIHKIQKENIPHSSTIKLVKKPIKDLELLKLNLKRKRELNVESPSINPTIVNSSMTKNSSTVVNDSLGLHKMSSLKTSSVTTVETNFSNVESFTSPTPAFLLDDNFTNVIKRKMSLITEVSSTSNTENVFLVSSPITAKQLVTSPPVTLPSVSPSSGTIESAVSSLITVMPSVSSPITALSSLSSPVILISSVTSPITVVSTVTSNLSLSNFDCLLTSQHVISQTDRKTLSTFEKNSLIIDSKMKPVNISSKTANNQLLEINENFEKNLSNSVTHQPPVLHDVMKTSSETLLTQSLSFLDAEKQNISKHLHENGLCITNPRMNGIALSNMRMHQINNSMHSTFLEQTTTNHQLDRRKRIKIVDSILETDITSQSKTQTMLPSVIVPLKTPSFNQSFNQDQDNIDSKSNSCNDSSITCPALNNVKPSKVETTVSSKFHSENNESFQVLKNTTSTNVSDIDGYRGIKRKRNMS